MRTWFTVRFVPAAIAIALIACAVPPSASAQRHSPSGGGNPMSPADAYALLVRGHASYKTTDKSIATCFSCARDSTGAGQHPFAGVLTCMDSRTTPEYIFNMAPGSFFVFRDGGNVADSVIVGSMEYAAVVKKAPILVVMGHTNCGAIAGACDSTMSPAPPPMLGSLLRSLRPVIRRTAAGGYPSAGCNQPFLDSAASMNVLMTIEKIKAMSPAIASLVREGKLAIVGCRFDVASGDLRWLTPRP